MKRSSVGNAVIRWLLAGDPAICWQVRRDLTDASVRTVEQQRRNVATVGWGARLLERQDPEGTWGSGLYTPKWTSTTYTMLLLRDFGLPADNAQAGKAAALLLAHGLQRDGGINYGASASGGETCITGMVLSLLACFAVADARVDTVVEHLLAQQMPDGGWNCQRRRGATHASVHTTISALEGLCCYEQHCGRNLRAVRVAQRRGREFLLVHRLFRSHRTGKIIDPAFTRFAFPPRWHFDVLRALDHFRATGAPRDPRLLEAIDIVRGSRRPDGRWLLPDAWPGRTHFPLEQAAAPSRWNTLRALRVLRWWEGAN